MRVVTVPASQDAVIKLENSNSPVYTCMLSLGPLRRMQLSNAYTLSQVYSEISVVMSCTVDMYTIQYNSAFLRAIWTACRLRSKYAILLFGKLRDENSLFSLLGRGARRGGGGPEVGQPVLWESKHIKFLGMVNSKIYRPPLTQISRPIYKRIYP
jgi:hypothetical protein